MGAFLAILIFVGFIFLLMAVRKERNSNHDVSSSKVGYLPKPNSSELSYSSSTTNIQADWNTAIFGEEVFKDSVNLYQQGMQIYQLSPENASLYFEKSFNSIQRLRNSYSNNPIFYLNLVECAMGFDYDVAIANGYKFFDLIGRETLRLDQIATSYDVSRKMYKLLILRGKFDEGKRFASKTIHLIDEILKRTHNESLGRERDIAGYFYGSLTEGDYSVQRNIVPGFDSPEPWCHFDIFNEPQMMKKIENWVKEIMNYF
jgi:hypothetical protein